jgi:hypothetical protein
VISDASGEMVADLAGGQGITKRAQREWPRLTATAGRFVVSAVVRRAALPEPLGEEAFLVPPNSGRPDPRRPVVHLQRYDPALHPDAPSEARDEALLVAEILLPTRGPLTLLEAREAVLSTLREHLPFLDRHLLVVDSTHDGLPLYDYTSGKKKEIDRLHLQGTGTAPESMQWLWSTEPVGYPGRKYRGSGARTGRRADCGMGSGASRDAKRSRSTKDAPPNVEQNRNQLGSAVENFSRA